MAGGEEAPILAARLITGTPLHDPLPNMELRLATTRGTNALLERKGAPTALFVTRGFGDLLRSLLYQQQGSRAMLAQGVAGSIKRKMVFCLPGDLDIIELAMSKLILPELEHLLDQMIPRA